MSNLKRFLALTIAMLMVVGAMATASAKTFADVADTDAYYNAVDVLSELGVIVGTSETEFSPEALVQRQQMAMFIGRLATAKPAWFAGTAPAVYADQNDPVFNYAIQYASSNGIIVGTSATTFEGEKSVTMQDAATMLCRALGYSSPELNAQYPFSYLAIADEIGLLAGLDALAPTDEMTRGEVAIMLLNALNANMAVVDIAMGPNGPTYIVRVPEAGDTIKTLAGSKWGYTPITGRIVATGKLTFETFNNFPATKAIADPVKIDGITTPVSFASIAKFFPEGAVAEDFVGVDLKILKRGDNILKIDVIGSKQTIANAAYVVDAAGASILTVNGVAYNLTQYGLGETYPTEGNNCVYLFEGNNISKLVNTSDLAKLNQIATGLYTIDILNEGANSQMFVFKPLKFGQVTADAAGTLLLGTAITNNAAGAVKDDFVTYFDGGSNFIETVEKAVKSAAVTVSKISVSAGTATMSDGTAVPAAAGAPITGASLIDLAVGGNYYVYRAGGVVLKTESVSVPSVYTPKTYYKVTAADIITGTFGAKTHALKIVNAAGAESVLNVTKIDGVAVPADIETFDNIVGMVITIDPADGTNVITSGNAGFIAASESLKTSASTTISKANSVFTIASESTNFVLADYSKILVKGTDGLYASFSGKTFNGFAGTSEVPQALSNVVAVMHTNDVGLLELVYLYADSSFASTAVQLGGAAPAANLYLFKGIDSYDATSVTYNVFSLATGESSQQTFVNAAAGAGGSAAIMAVTAGKMGASSAIYNVQAGQALPVIANEARVTFKTSTNGYLVYGSTILTVNGSKFYAWDAATANFVTTTVTAGVETVGLVVADAGAAKYVTLTAPTLVASVSVVSGADGVTEIETPVVEQVIRANIVLNDGSTIYTYPANPDATYTWYYKDNGQVIGTQSSYTVTSDNIGETICVTVTLGNKGTATWEAEDVVADPELGS